MERVIGKIGRAAGVLVFAIALPILYLLWPFKKIRFSNLFEERIGHLITEPFLLRRQLTQQGRQNDTTDIFIISHPANAQAARMVGRAVTVWNSHLLRRLFFDVMPLMRRTRFYAETPQPIPAHDLYSMDAPRPAFTAEEEACGQEGLRRLGIGSDDWFVCFHSRTPAYLGQTWNTVRDSRIDDYIPAARWIAEQGGFAVRMGTPTEAPLPDLGPRVIDYACKHRDDFMDVYLLAHCRFFIGSTSGPICIPVLMGIPSGMGNKMPYYLTGMGKHTLYTPKLLRSQASGAILSFPEIRALGLYDSAAPDDDRPWNPATYLAMGLDIIDTPPEDLTDLAKDLLDMANGILPSAEAHHLQERYHALHTDGNLADCAGRIGPRFIVKHRHLLLESATPSP